MLKEARALLSIWLASASAMLVYLLAGPPLIPRSPLLFLLGLCAFVLGAVALGAFSVGHEYAYRTLPALLAQPLSRPRILWSKAAALVPLLVALAILARSMLLRADASDSVSGANTGAWIETITILVPVLGFCVAPWLTMIFRNAIAGVVFTLAIPAGLWLAINVVPAIDGVDTPHDSSLDLTIFWTGILAASAFALVAGVRRFVRFEATEGVRGITVARTRRQHVPSGSEAGRRRHLLAQLVTKELRLQHVTFLLSALYVLAWAANVATNSTLSLGPAFFGMTVVYCGVTALLVGALASAEERALGTLAVQALQPLAAWKQWLVKAATALALTVAFTVLLPRVLEWAHPLGQGQASWRLSSAFLALTACSLYISSLSTGALQALLLSMPFTAVVGSLFWMVTSKAARFGPLSYPFQTLSANWTRPIPLLSSTDWTWYVWSESWLPVVIVCGLVALLIWFAERNHRSAEHGLGRLRRQLAWIAPCVLVGALISGALPPLILWFLATH
jgi:hypothetical protein